MREEKDPIPKDIAAPNEPNNFQNSDLDLKSVPDDDANECYKLSLSQRRPLTFIRKICFGVGHVLNDLCAAMWFSYLLIFFHRVLNFSNTYAGAVILLGQVVDALATPFVGIQSDRSVSGCFKYGRRKSWHLIGTIAVVLSFPFLFIDFIHCHETQDWIKFIYFAPFVTLFQFGWAAVQIAHLALIPDLATDDPHRVELNAIRYGWTVMSNLAVYVITWLILRMDTAGSKAVNPNDAQRFQMIVFILVGVGTMFSVIFHLGVKENSHKPNVKSATASTNSEDIPTAVNADVTCRNWFREPQFYIVSLLYMSSRLFVNLTQVYLPMYLLDTLHLSKESIGYIPLVVYTTGFVISLIMKSLNRCVGNKVSCTFGIFIGLGACIWIQVIQSGGWAYGPQMVYGVAALLGASGTLLMVSSLAITGELISGSTGTGAFVFGVMSFTDKLSNGIAVMAIQLMGQSTEANVPDSWFFVKVMVYVPSGACIVALFAITLLSRQTVGVRHRDRKKALKASNATCNKVQENEFKILLKRLLLWLRIR